MNRPRIYIACPISKPRTEEGRERNFAQAAAAHLDLMANGFAALNPALTMKLPWAWDRPHSEWLDCCFPWVAVADAVLRLPGESDGADQEEAFANARDIPVFHSLQALYHHFHRCLKKPEDAA